MSELLILGIVLLAAGTALTWILGDNVISNLPMVLAFLVVLICYLGGWILIDQSVREWRRNRRARRWLKGQGD